jgi:hypothetical protein
VLSKFAGYADGMKATTIGVSLCISTILLSAKAFAGLLGKVPTNAMSTLQSACEKDIKKLCSGTPPTKIMACLKSQDPKKLSTSCAKQMGTTQNLKSLTK